MNNKMIRRIFYISSIGLGSFLSGSYLERKRINEILENGKICDDDYITYNKIKVLIFIYFYKFLYYNHNFVFL